jgi:prepilin-type N-terminal cleavage/methylation domain-containing protein
MKRDRGFTLIELLVVISMVALLVAILVPCLGKARNAARDVVCQSNLKQWDLILSVYTNAYEGSFPPGWWTAKGQWMYCMRSYYKEPKICLCPKAMKFQSDGNPAGTFVAWGIYGANGYPTYCWGVEGEYGSYGMNGWMCNLPDVSTCSGIQLPPGAQENWFWRNVNVVGGIDAKPTNIPVFGDCMWDGTNPNYDDKPPDPPGTKVGLGGMCDFAIPRHGNGDSVNISFLDESVRKTSLKSLWKLKWHRYFQTNTTVLWPVSGSWNYIREQ